MLNFNAIHPSWLKIVKSALNTVNSDYLTQLEQHHDWLPGPDAIFNAFTLPLTKTHYILLGESPYPRKISANGYAFWDAATDAIWLEQGGFSKSVNRATSLRNFIKMLLVAKGDLSLTNVSQPAIAALAKSNYIQTTHALFQNLLDAGFLLLNASLVLSENPVKYDAKQWQPFVHRLLLELANLKQPITLVLMGKIAEQLCPVAEELGLAKIIFEHPYNLSFIGNVAVQNFFRPFNLLSKNGNITSMD